MSYLPLIKSIRLFVWLSSLVILLSNVSNLSRISFLTQILRPLLLILVSPDNCFPGHHSMTNFPKDFILSLLCPKQLSFLAILHIVSRNLNSFLALRNSSYNSWEATLLCWAPPDPHIGIWNTLTLAFQPTSIDHN